MSIKIETMFLLKNMKLILLVCAVFLSALVSQAQLVGGHSYMMGDRVNIAVGGPTGREGTPTVGAGFHQRAPGTRCGFVADPDGTGWGVGLFDGDYFMPGTEENGWGAEIDGVRYGNNYDINEIPADPLKPVTHVVEGDCITAEWEGSVAGITFNIKYHLVFDEVFYTTEVTIINNSGSDKTDLYYYRNVDPDNNQSIGGTYTTLNTIVSQPGVDCQKSLVSATQATPHESYVGFGALGDKFRVTYGGFSNRDGSDIWNGVGGLTGTVGSVHSGDEAISLAYKTDILDGDTVNFTYAVVLSDDAVEGAFSSLYYIDYTSIGGDGGGLINQCNPVIDTAKSCAGNIVTLTVDGPNAGDYDWVWTSDPFDPDAATTGPTIDVAPDVTTTYTVEGTPVTECLSNTITKTIVVEFSEGPEISITDPGPYCEEFDINDLVFTDLNGTVDPNIVFLTEYPDSSSQVEPAFVGPLMGPDDEVWLMIGDTAAGCYDAVLIEIDFGGLGAAGADSTIELCGTAGTIVDLHDLIEPGANTLGSFVEVTASGQFNAATGELNVGGLGGTYEFTYTVVGIAPCPDDEATFTVEVFPQPNADFEYIVDGVSSADGLGSTCIINTIEFDNNSSAPPGSTWEWDFGDAGTSALENPEHTYGAVGTYTITLTVTSPDGCVDTHTKEIIIYTEPVLDVIFNDPTCFGFTDGSVTAFVAGGSGTFDIEILDSDGVLKNDPESNTANLLSAGVYTINVMDGSGCSATATVTLIDPLQLIPTYHVIEPNCYGELGAIVVDTVQGEAINNSVYYFWNPEGDVPNGLGADSINVVAGDYVLTINDDKGCSNVVTITVTQPDELVFTSDLGYDPAYCRVFSYQNGGGVVYGAAAGGTGAITYLWEELATGNTTTNTTWGGRNPGDYRLTVTDDNGCTKSITLTVDSLNPIADFTVESAQLNEDLKGTAPVEVVFTNASLYYYNVNDPSADPRFFWDLDHIYGENDWYITNDYSETRDTTYEARGDSYTIDVCLIAVNQNGCKDTACKELTIFEPIALTNVNIFSPNGDGDNDLFTFSFYAKSISEFECIIVNRWGVKVGEINNINDGWDGKDLSGSPCKDGVYFYTYKATADNGDKLEGQGNVQIVDGGK